MAKIAIFLPTKTNNQVVYKTAQMWSKEHTVEFVGSSIDVLAEDGYPQRNPLRFEALPFVSLVEKFISVLIYGLRHKPDVIVTFYKPGSEGLMALLVSKLVGCASIVRFSIDPFKEGMFSRNRLVGAIKSFWTRMITLRALSHADAAVVMSPSVREKLIEYGFLENRVWIIMQPLDNALFRVDRQFMVPPEIAAERAKGKNVAVYVGLVAERKGIDTILNVWDDPEVASRWTILVIGPGSENYRQRNRLLSNDAIKVIGSLHQEKTSQYLVHTDVFFFPSHVEGFPKAVTEAFSRGCCIIARDIVDIGRLAPHLFTTDEEAKALLLDARPARVGNKEFPAEFRNDYIEEQCLQLIDFACCSDG